MWIPRVTKQQPTFNRIISILIIFSCVFGATSGCRSSNSVTLQLAHLEAKKRDYYYQRISIFAHSDWLLKLRIYTCIYLLLTKCAVRTVTYGPRGFIRSQLPVLNRRLRCLSSPVTKLHIQESSSCNIKYRNGQKQLSLCTSYFNSQLYSRLLITCGRLLKKLMKHLGPSFCFLTS